MIVEKIKSEGLAHLSYLIGDAKEAAVIDPRRDCETYVERAHALGLQITHIFETHRNEDLVSGAPALSEMTGAPVHHGPNPEDDIVYADTVRDGDSFRFGGMTLRVLETPGHTFDSVSYAIYDDAFGESAVGVFTGDALFIGDVGRTDFYPDRAREVAGLLYDSLQKIMALGDQALVYPAHGAGSVCGSGMAAREFSSIGYERRQNPKLAIESREAFIEAKTAENHYIPPYFKLMEKLNSVGGAPVPRALEAGPAPSPEGIPEGARVIDVRDVTAFAGAHVPGALSLPEAMIPGFAGWFLSSDEPLFLVASNMDEARKAMRHFARIGFDRIAGVDTGIVARVAGGDAFEQIDTVDHETVASRLEGGAPDWTLLDVRAIDEVEASHIPNSQHLYLGHLPERLGELDRQRHHTVMCGSGVRAMIAAAYLKSQGFRTLDVFLGSMGAWQAHHES